MKLEQITGNGYYAKKGDDFYMFSWTANDTLRVYLDRKSIEVEEKEYEIVEVVDGVVTHALSEPIIDLSSEEYSRTTYYEGSVNLSGVMYPFTLVVMGDTNASESNLEVTWLDDEPHCKDVSALEEQIIAKYHESQN